MVNRNFSDLHVLVLEPYYGGSHKSFLSGLKKLPFTFELMTLPARKWKWRMRFAAPFYAQKLHKLNRKFDRILCSTFVDVATFRALAPDWVNNVPLLTYFHENQFAYPVQVDDNRDLHFALTNMTTAFASDSLAFNSAYNLESFLKGIEQLQKMSCDVKLDNPGDAVRSKSRVIPPGVDFSSLDAGKPGTKEPAVIVWNHRWEHDKDPDQFFKALFELDRRGLHFELIVLGESFREHPPIFDAVREKLSHRILQFGYVDSRRDYTQWLKRGSLIVSTASHEFFGISVIEAVRAGCRPLLPNRLSYPELFPAEFLYDEENFSHRLEEEVLRGKGLSGNESRILTDRFSWNSLLPVYKEWIIMSRRAACRKITE